MRLKHYFIEPEEFTGDPMTELREDAEYMRNFNVEDGRVLQAWKGRHRARLRFAAAFSFRLGT